MKRMVEIGIFVGLEFGDLGRWASCRIFNNDNRVLSGLLHRIMVSEFIEIEGLGHRLL